MSEVTNKLKGNWWSFMFCNYKMFDLKSVYVEFSQSLWFWRSVSKKAATLMKNILKVNFSVEHNLGCATGVLLSKSCWNVRSAEEAYFRQSFTEFFSIFTFNIYLGLFAQVVNVFWWVWEMRRVILSVFFHSSYTAHSLGILLMFTWLSSAFFSLKSFHASIDVLQTIHVLFQHIFGMKFGARTKWLSI